MVGFYIICNNSIIFRIDIVRFKPNILLSIFIILHIKPKLYNNSNPVKTKNKVTSHHHPQWIV